MSRNNQPQETLVPRLSSYSLFVFLDETTDGDTIYVATNPDLPGCIAQGDTIAEAEDILAEVREDYIAYLLAHNLAVPEPQSAWSVESSLLDRPIGYRIIEPAPEQAAEMPEINLQMALTP